MTKADVDKKEDKDAEAPKDDFVADRVSDRAPTPSDVDAQRDELDPGLGERLAQEASDERSPKGGEVKGVEESGVFSVVTTPVVDQSENGKVYTDSRINPRDTNAPDAGLTPDGRRIAS